MSVVPLRRPPVEVSTIVEAGIERTFDAFVGRIDTWWPLRRFSAGAERACTVTVERRAGGRVYESWDDGTTVDWGDIRAWDPPTRLTMSWHNTPAPTEVELRFQPLGPALTRVTVEHRGWETLTEEQLAQDCALPGGYTSGAYRDGWTSVLERFAAFLAEENDPR